MNLLDFLTSPPAPRNARLVCFLDGHRPVLSEILSRSRGSAEVGFEEYVQRQKHSSESQTKRRTPCEEEEVVVVLPHEYMKKWVLATIDEVCK